MKIILSKITSFFKKIKLSKLHLILIALGLFILLGIISFIYLQQRQHSFLKGGPGQSQGWGQRPGGAQELSQPAGQISSPAQPPKNKISTYKGFWMPCSFMDDSCQPMNDANLLKSMGVNIIGIAPNIKINSKGEVKFFPMDYTEKRLNEITRTYYNAGIRVFISPELDFTQDLNSRGQGEPRPIPKEAAAKPGFLDKYDLIITDLAKLAEKYQVEMFSPMNEPDMKLGINVASKWGQKILPVVRQNYKGKVIWKLGMAADSSSSEINFKGYDVLGLDFTAPGGSETQSLANFPQITNKIISDALTWTKRDGISEIILSEVGVWGGAIKFSDSGKAIVHKIIFEQGKGRVKGFIILDPPPDQGWSIKNTGSAEEIKIWFTQKLN